MMSKSISDSISRVYCHKSLMLSNQLLGYISKWIRMGYGLKRKDYNVDDREWTDNRWYSTLPL